MADDMNEQVTVRLPRGAWNQLIAIIWKSATCEVGYPLIEALRPQLEQKATPRNGTVMVDE
jgi:hypothetical protein